MNRKQASGLNAKGPMEADREKSQAKLFLSSVPATRTKHSLSTKTSHPECQITLLMNAARPSTAHGGGLVETEPEANLPTRPDVELTPPYGSYRAEPTGHLRPRTPESGIIGSNLVLCSLVVPRKRISRRSFCSPPRGESLLSTGPSRSAAIGTTRYLRRRTKSIPGRSGGGPDIRRSE